MSNKPKKLSVPRTLEEIQREASDVYFKAGQCQYTVSVYENELKHLNERLLVLNNEAAARNKLDKDKQEAQLEVTNVGQ